MKPLTNCLLLFIALLCLATSCKDDEMPPPPDPIDPDGLPLPTQTGENTFGCLINGEPWIAEIGLEIINPSLRKIDMSYDELNYGMFFNNNWSLSSNQVSDSINEYFVFTANRIDSEGMVTLENNNLKINHYSSQQQFNWYSLDSLSSNQIEITNLDTLNNICSGTFEFHLISDNMLDTIYITKGRFDKKYNPE